MRLRTLVGSVAALAVAALVGLAVLPASSSATTPPATPAPAPASVPYVNMGDSYSAGAGVAPPAAGAPPRCLQSALNWGHDLAKRFPVLRLSDVSCSGAQTKDFTARQFPEVPPQLDALSSSTRVVTLTIGGNDSNVFSDLITQCGSAAVRTAGKGSPCKDTRGSSFATTIRTSTYPNLVSTLRAVRQKAPNAKVAISGYLQVLPAETGCFPIVPIAAGDVPYVNGIEDTLNDAVRRAASATGVTFLDQKPTSTGHDACQPVGTRWVEPVIGSTNTVPVHPNALGEKAMADRAVAVLAANLR